MICQSCERGKHEECDDLDDVFTCDCPCQHPPPIWAHIDYPDLDEKLMWADLRRKERKENG